jgi:hypothetical protein
MPGWCELEKVSPILRRWDFHYQGKARWNLWFICPACKEAHAFDERWDFNGNYEKPTFSPSFLTWVDANPQATREPFISGRRCHSFVRDGMIEYQSDCTHEFGGQTVPIPLWSDKRA